MNPNTKPTASEYGQRRSYYAKLGVSQEQFELMFGTPGKKKTRKEAADNTIEWVKQLKKKEV